MLLSLYRKTIKSNARRFRHCSRHTRHPQCATSEFNGSEKSYIDRVRKNFLSFWAEFALTGRKITGCDHKQEGPQRTTANTMYFRKVSRKNITLRLHKSHKRRNGVFHLALNTVSVSATATNVHRAFLVRMYSRKRYRFTHPDTSVLFIFIIWRNLMCEKDDIATAPDNIANSHQHCAKSNSHKNVMFAFHTETATGF